MKIADLLFIVFAAMVIFPAGVVVFAPKLIDSAFALLFTLFGVAGLFAFLGADFLAAAQVLVYVGGVLVILLFGVLLTRRIQDTEIRVGANQVWVGSLVSAAVLSLLSVFIFRAEWIELPESPPEPTTASIGNLLMTRFVLPFEVASIFLLAALIGAVIIGRSEEG
jgi:NADH-quinone oxidoreductase subunit J